MKGGLLTAGTLILVPLALQEFVDWCPWIAARLINLAARLLPMSFRTRYKQEWLAEIAELPGGKLTKLAFALRILIAAPRTAQALDGRPAVYMFAVKGMVDRVLAGVALLLLAPLLLGIAIAIRLTSHGPVIFRQTRIGKGGREFTMFKFRTMVADAESRRSELVGAKEWAEGPLFKIRRGPRITPIGRVLRKFSLDELPQLVNIVIGDMSLVGPRPPLPEEVALYEADVRRRLLIKPGLTGLWQISGRSDLTWDESVRLDLRYVENWSLTPDFMILWKTGFAVSRNVATRPE